MAKGVINLQKESGGITKISSVDGTKVTEVIVPESGELATKFIGSFIQAYTIYDNCIVAFGGEFNRADYPKLWAYLQANPSLVKTQAQWQTEATANDGICGFYSDGNGTTTFRVPNLREATLKFSDRGIATYETDNIKAHRHTLVTLDGANTSFTSGGSPRLVSYQNSLKNTSIEGTAKNTVENIAVLPLIVAK